ncbi:hypothetical protein [Corallococcus sp. M7]
MDCHGIERVAVGRQHAAEVGGLQLLPEALNPSDWFARYALNVEDARIRTDHERRQLRAIVEYLNPVHTHFVDLIKSLPPVLPNHWELAFGDLGETTNLQ